VKRQGVVSQIIQSSHAATTTIVVPAIVLVGNVKRQGVVFQTLNIGVASTTTIAVPAIVLVTDVSHKEFSLDVHLSF
jgi:hypothetical protein